MKKTCIPPHLNTIIYLCLFLAYSYPAVSFGYGYEVYQYHPDGTKTVWLLYMSKNARVNSVKTQWRIINAAGYHMPVFNLKLKPGYELTFTMGLTSKTFFKWQYREALIKIPGCKCGFCKTNVNHDWYFDPDNKRIKLNESPLSIGNDLTPSEIRIPFLKSLHLKPPVFYK